MKKFGLVMLMALAMVGFVSAAGEIVATTAAPTEATMPANPAAATAVINAYLAGYLNFTGLTSRYDFMLNTAGETKDVATATIATNLKNWKLTVKSANANGTSAALVTSDADALRIPYTLKLVGGTNIGTVWTAEPLASAAAGTTKTFTQRVSNGTGGEMITLSINYGSEASNIDNWSSNKTYTDTLTVTVASN